MLKISDAIKEIVDKNSLLRFGMSYRLLNLSQTARFIKPLVEARVKKPVQVTALIMNLSRQQQRMKRKAEEDQFKIENIIIRNNLCTMTFFADDAIRDKINKLYAQIRDEKGFMTITQGASEITIIFENSFVDLVNKVVKEKSKYKNNQICSVGIKFNEKYLEVPGLLYLILQQVALQDINIVEINSTGTELMIYVDEKDAKLAFDTIYGKFLERLY